MTHQRKQMRLTWTHVTETLISIKICINVSINPFIITQPLRVLTVALSSLRGLLYLLEWVQLHHLPKIFKQCEVFFHTSWTKVLYFTEIKRDNSVLQPLPGFPAGLSWMYQSSSFWRKACPRHDAATTFSSWGLSVKDDLSSFDQSFFFHLFVVSPTWLMVQTGQLVVFFQQFLPSWRSQPTFSHRSLVT